MEVVEAGGWHRPTSIACRRSGKSGSVIQGQMHDPLSCTEPQGVQQGTNYLSDPFVALTHCHRLSDCKSLISGRRLVSQRDLPRTSPSYAILLMTLCPVFDVPGTQETPGYVPFYTFPGEEVAVRERVLKFPRRFDLRIFMVTCNGSIRPRSAHRGPHSKGSTPLRGSIPPLLFARPVSTTHSNGKHSKSFTYKQHAPVIVFPRLVKMRRIGWITPMGHNGRTQNG